MSRRAAAATRCCQKCWPAEPRRCPAVLFDANTFPNAAALPFCTAAVAAAVASLTVWEIALNVLVLSARVFLGKDVAAELQHDAQIGPVSARGTRFCHGDFIGKGSRLTLSHGPGLIGKMLKVVCCYVPVVLIQSGMFLHNGQPL